MGYDRQFSGAVQVSPLLNPAEISYLQDFNRTRRMRRTKGAYFVKGNGRSGQNRDPDIEDFNASPIDQPGLWCQWTPSEDGLEITWDGAEKFYFAGEWMAYVIDHFLRPGAYARGSTEDERFAQFSLDHVVNGTIQVQGEDPGDVWQLIVKDNVVSTAFPAVDEDPEGERAGVYR